jgi:uncharacterized damage-inducible protein DinB
VNLLDILDGRGWSIQQAIQTTYPFDPQFYSSYVRPRLQRRNCELPLVLVDGNRYEREITSADWREAPIGTDYLLEPVHSSGVFHPKVNLFASERSVFYSVSSANLTLEEYCKAAQIGFADGFQKPTSEDETAQLDDSYFVAKSIRDFYTELLGYEDFITGQDARTYITETAETLAWLDEIDESAIDGTDRNTWFVSNLDNPIVTQLLDRVTEHGGREIERARLYAPYFGSPTVLRDLAERLDATHLELLVEPESTALAVDELAETLSTFEYSVRRLQPDRTTRWVHAKFMVLDGEWGQACLYGSPNMTSTALTASAAHGNVEAGLVTIAQETDEETLEEAVFDSSAFQFTVSESVANPAELDLRSASYENWETRTPTKEEEVRLEDARVTQPSSEGDTELILTIAGLSGNLEIQVHTDTGAEKTVEVPADESPQEVTLLLTAAEREQWTGAVVTVTVAGTTSNPRRVVEEMQAYYREYREITRSAGTQSSNTLLREVLQNPDTAAVNVFDIALSELQKRAKQAGDDSPQTDTRSQNDPDGERLPPKLTEGDRSLPSLHSLVENHLSYHREQALAALTVTDRPEPATLNAFTDHAQTFWETIELCFALDRLGHLDTDRIDTENLFEACESEIDAWLTALTQVVQLVNGIIDQAEQNPDVQELLFGHRDHSIRDEPAWQSLCEILFLHPGIILEFEHHSHYTVFRSQNRLASRLVSVFIDVHPYIGQHFLTGAPLIEQVNTLLSNLTVELGDDDSEIELSGRGIQALLLYLLIQRFANQDAFFDGATPHPDTSEDDISAVAGYAIQAEDALVTYDLMSSLMLTVTVKKELDDIKSLATG